jgi:predicted amidophosphoribosyltransferase
MSEDIPEGKKLCPKCKKARPEDEFEETDIGEEWCDRCCAKFTQQCDGCGICITGKPKVIDDYELCPECAENWEEEYDDEDDWDDDEDEDEEEDDDE